MYQKMLCTGTALGILFYHTQNSNHLDQNIGSNRSKRSLLVNDYTAERNVLQE